MKRMFLFLILPVIVISSCAVYPKGEFNPQVVPSPPDFSDLGNWAAHPDKADPADRTPADSILSVQSESGVDVLFFHPTTLFGKKRYGAVWNADVRNEYVNKRTDDGSALFQGSIFNGTGRVFMPRYRQAHLDVFFRKSGSESAKKALQLAYTDISNAFDYYLEHWNGGRPFIIAGHSQGALHAMTLIKNRIDGTPLKSQLIAAYIVGWPVHHDYFTGFKPCETPEQTDCYCTWRTWNREYVLKNGNNEKLIPGIVCTNPILWTIEEGVYAPRESNKGGLSFDFTNLHPAFADAEVYKGVLMASKPKFRGSIFFNRVNYHIGDLNLYYMNIRENARLRAQSFMKK